jgi:S-adenosylmethionine hydrolase
MHLITFLSDFGQNDGYVGCVEGMILSLNPSARIINISHNILPYQIEQAAYVVSSYVRYFPADTVHLVVIDPGVGGDRRPLVIKTDNCFFVGPDNGLFSYILKKGEFKLYEIATSLIKKHTSKFGAISSTFHARDIFGPAAALLSKGIIPDKIGRPSSRPPLSIITPIVCEQNKIKARIISIDHFGNIITNLAHLDLEQQLNRKIQKIIIKDETIDKLYKTYSDVPKGALLALWGSSGYLEISMNQGNAAKHLDCKIGQHIVEIFLKNIK